MRLAGFRDSLLTGMAIDIGYNFRQLRHSPGFTITAVVSLALGIGATTAMFSLIYGALLHPYPYAGADRMVNPAARDLTLPAGVSLPFTADWFRLTGPQFQVFRRAKAIDDVEGFDWTQHTITSGELPENVSACLNTANIATFMKVAPALGREIMPSDAPPGKPAQPVLVLSYRFWQRHYGANRSVIGRILQLDHVNYTIIGIRSARNTFGGSDVSLPIQIPNDPNVQLIPYIKLKPSVTLAAANAEFQALLEQFAKETPTHFPTKFRVGVQRLVDPVVQVWGTRFTLLFAAVVLLLLIGCANCSILLLARGTARQHELSVRTALGASRARIVRQLITESLILSSIGSALGIVLAYRLPELPLKWTPTLFASESAAEINLPVLCFTVAAALLTGILFGLYPALRLSRFDLIQRIRATTRGATAGRGAKHFHTALVAAQIAVTLVLLAGATTASAAFLKLLRANPGFNRENTLDIHIPLHRNSYMRWSQRAIYFDQLRQKISSVPGVLGVAIANNGRPPTNAEFGGPEFEIRGKPSIRKPRAGASLVSENYFSLLQIPLLRGRAWTRSEISHGARLVVVNKAFAAKYWPGEDAIGQQIQIPDLKSSPPFVFASSESEGALQIIGVVADARNNGLLRPVQPALYLPYTALMWPDAEMLVRTQGSPLASLHAIRNAVQSANPEQEVGSDARTLEQYISLEPEWGQEHVVSVFFSIFAILALALAAAGLYSVVSFSVNQRTNELGIRVALGAQSGDVFWLVSRSTMTSVSIGLLAGILLIVLFSKLMGQWVEGSVRDPLIVIPVTCMLIVVAALASGIPARRALSIHPMHALRHE